MQGERSWGLEQTPRYSRIVHLLKAILPVEQQHVGPVQHFPRGERALRHRLLEARGGPDLRADRRQAAERAAFRSTRRIHPGRGPYDAIDIC